jgi:hypothetical protein
VASERRQRNRVPGARGAPASAKLFVPIPEDELLAGELELIQAHFAALIARVFPPEDHSDTHGGNQLWP